MEVGGILFNIQRVLFALYSRILVLACAGCALKSSNPVTLELETPSIFPCRWKQLELFIVVRPISVCDIFPDILSEHDPARPMAMAST